MKYYTFIILCSCLVADSCLIRNCKTIFQSSYTIHIPSSNEGSSCSKVLLGLGHSLAGLLVLGVWNKTKGLIALSDSSHMTFLKWKNSRNRNWISKCQELQWEEGTKCKRGIGKPLEEIKLFCILFVVVAS